MRYMILKLHGNATPSSCDQRLFFSLGALRLVDAASPRTINIVKKKRSSGTQGFLFKTACWTMKEEALRSFLREHESTNEYQLIKSIIYVSLFLPSLMRFLLKRGYSRSSLCHSNAMDFFVSGVSLYSRFLAVSLIPQLTPWSVGKCVSAWPKIARSRLSLLLKCYRQTRGVWLHAMISCTVTRHTIERDQGSLWIGTFREGTALIN